MLLNMHTLDSSHPRLLRAVKKRGERVWTVVVERGLAVYIAPTVKRPRVRDRGEGENGLRGSKQPNLIDVVAAANEAVTGYFRLASRRRILEHNCTRSSMGELIDRAVRERQEG